MDAPGQWREVGLSRGIGGEVGGCVAIAGSVYVILGTMVDRLWKDMDLYRNSSGTRVLNRS